MNNLRILRVSNVLLLATGYQLHWFDLKCRHYRLSIGGIINFVLLALFYAICFSQHFEQSALLQMLQDMSPFLQKLIRLQLLLGCKALIYTLWESRVVIRVANDFVAQLPRVYSRKFQRDEAFAYFLLFSTLILGFGYVLYIACEMKFILPPLDHVLIGCALFLPHFVIAGALKLYNIITWLACVQFSHLTEDIADVLVEPVKIDAPNVNAAVNITTTGSNVLLNYQKQFSSLAEKLDNIARAIQVQLLLYFMLNINCLLAGVYMFVYFTKTWYVMFEERNQRIFYAGNSAIFVLIFWDYLCLLLTQFSVNKVRENFIKRLDMALHQRTVASKPMRVILKELRSVLENGFQLKFFSCWRFNVLNFIHLNVGVLLIVSFIVAYHYLNDQIIAINTRLDSNDDE